MSQQNVVEIIRQHPDPLEACHAVVQEAYDLWLQVRACFGVGGESRGGWPRMGYTFVGSPSSFGGVEVHAWYMYISVAHLRACISHIPTLQPPAQYEVRTDDITIIAIYIDATAGVKTAAAAMATAAAAAAGGPPATPKCPSGRVTGPRPSPRSPRGGSLPISSLDVSATVATPTSISRAMEAAAAAAAVGAGGGGGGEGGGTARED